MPTTSNSRNLLTLLLQKIKLLDNLNKSRPNNLFKNRFKSRLKRQDKKFNNLLFNKLQLLLKDQFNKKSQPKSQLFKAPNQPLRKLCKVPPKFQQVSKDLFKLKERLDHQEETTETEIITEVQEKTEAQENSENQERTEAQENSESQDNQENPENPENQEEKVNNKVKEEDITKTGKNPTTDQRTKKMGLIRIHLWKENKPSEPSRRKKSDNSKMMDSKLLESQNQKPRRDKENGTRKLTAEKPTTTNNKTDCTSKNKNPNPNQLSI